MCGHAGVLRAVQKTGVQVDVDATGNSKSPGAIDDTTSGT